VGELRVQLPSAGFTKEFSILVRKSPEEY